MEYLNYQGQWVRVEDPNFRWGTGEQSTWYDTVDGWTRSSINGAYNYYMFPTSLISGEFGQQTTTHTKLSRISWTASTI